jgi:hypothetical protein
LENKKPFDLVFILYYKNLHVLGPYLYGIKMWIDQGYNVSIVSLDKRTNHQLLSESKTSPAYENVDFPKYITFISNLLFIFGYFLKLIGQKTRPGKWRSLLKMFYFALITVKKHNRKNHKNIFIATDPVSLWTCSQIAKKTNSSYYYFNRELFLSKDNTDLTDRIVKKYEREGNRNAIFTTEFDEIRAELLVEDNYITLEDVRIIANAPPGYPSIRKSNYLREKFEISPEKKIALFTGGIADYNLIYEHFTSTREWPENVVLVVHCWGNESQLNKLLDFSKKYINRVFISTEMLPFEEIDNLYQSADIGFAMYGSQDLNHQYAGLSSGKLFNFMKSCIPVITNNTSVLRNAIEKTGCGICIDNLTESANAIRDILSRPDFFKTNCLNTFPDYSFSENYTHIMNEIIDNYENAKQ